MGGMSYHIRRLEDEEKDKELVKSRLIAGKIYGPCLVPWDDASSTNLEPSPEKSKGRRLAVSRNRCEDWR